MKKLVFLCPLIVGGLTACSNDSSTQDGSELATGIMQPVSGTGASEGGYNWKSDVQAAPMPASMAK